MENCKSSVEDWGNGEKQQNNQDAKWAHFDKQHHIDQLQAQQTRSWDLRTEAIEFKVGWPFFWWKFKIFWKFWKQIQKWKKKNSLLNFIILSHDATKKRLHNRWFIMTLSFLSNFRRPYTSSNLSFSSSSIY